MSDWILSMTNSVVRSLLKNEEKLIENFETTLNLINKVEDRRKVDYLSKLFSAFIEESIGYNEYLRLASLVREYSFY